MKKGWKRVLAVTMSAGCLVGLAGCADSAKKVEKDGESKKPESISIICSSDDVEYFKYIGDIYEEKYGIGVELISQAYDDTKTKIATTVTSGNADICYLDVVWPAEFSDKGMIISLDDYFTEDMQNQFLDGTVLQMKAGESIYGMPTCANGKWMYYNKKMLEEGGVKEPPKTWEEFKDICLSLQKQGLCKYGIAWPAQQAEGVMCDITTMIYSFGGTWFDENGEPAYNKQEAVEAVAFMKDSIDDGWADPSSVSYSDRDALNSFLAGDAAFTMCFSYGWDTANDPAQSKVADNVAVCLVPGSNGTTSAAVTGGGGLGILSTSKNPDWAWKYLELFTQEDIQKKGIELGGLLPSLKAVYEDETALKENETLSIFYPQFEYSVNRPAIAQYTEWSNTMQVAYSSIFNGDVDVQMGLDQAVKDTEQYLGK